jgi:hypothetical protein
MQLLPPHDLFAISSQSGPALKRKRVYFKLSCACPSRRMSEEKIALKAPGCYLVHSLLVVV